MITEIEVDGFKSLANFKLALNPGINVLAGPNGTGKTNIVSFFEFIAHLIESDPAEATSFLGGSGAILRRVKETHQVQICAKISGTYPFDQNGHFPFVFPVAPDMKGQFGHYEYGFTLLYTGELDPVVFARQYLKYKRTKTFIGHEQNAKNATDWDFEIDMDLNHEQMKPCIKVKTLTSAAQNLFPMFMPQIKDANAITQTESFIQSISSSSTPLPSIIARFSPLMLSLSADIAGGQAYNIIPAHVRLSEDSAKPPGIGSDGSGLSTTLYALKRRTPSTANLWHSIVPGRGHGFKTPSLDILKSYFQMANKSISDIDITLDNFNNQVQVRFDVKNGDYVAKIPLSLMSDGTLKWITLITAALTASSVFSIEEPENYLHPNMQTQCVTILRDILCQEKPHACILMTTHSETLLNSCKPSELIITNFVDGQTVAYRCTNEAEVSDEIAKTGFGLGYYYINNALQND